MKLDKSMVLFNAGGGLAILIVGAYFVKTTLFPDKAPPCTTTPFPAATALQLERDGDLFTAAEVQARLAGRDFGVIDNTRVVRVKGMKSPALEVSLPRGSLGPRNPAGPKGGVAFQWRPSSVEQASVACLSYQVWLPPDFDFKKGGTLPGLYGAADSGFDEKTAFAARFMWREGGAVEMMATLPQNGEPRNQMLDPDAFRLQPARWTAIEQEIALNTVGKKDGHIRVWVNGSLVINRTQLELRVADRVNFGGVQADIHYGGTDSSFTAPKDTCIRLTPFELRTK